MLHSQWCMVREPSKGRGNLIPSIFISILKITKTTEVNLDAGFLKGNIRSLPEYRQVFPGQLMGVLLMQIRQQMTQEKCLTLAVSIVQMHQAL